MKKNILLLAMSTLPNDLNKENYYSYAGNDIVTNDPASPMQPFKAKSQLEPVTRLLAEQLKKHDQKLDHIIILATPETQKDVDRNGETISAVEFYKRQISSFVDHPSEIITPILIEEDAPANGIKLATEKIIKLSRNTEANESVQLWIDTQGGFRDIVMVCNAIISLLFEQHIEPKGIFSIRYKYNNSKDDPCPIINQTEQYRIFSFVSAMQEFIDYGKATGLKKYYGDDHQITQIISEIADAIQLCQPKELEQGITKLSEYFNELDTKTLDPYLQIFITFIKDDYGNLLSEPKNPIYQIEWCLKKEFYQQAVTIYVESLPQYYITEKRVPIRESDITVASISHNEYAEAFYEKLYDQMLTDEVFSQFEEKLQNIKSAIDSVPKTYKNQTLQNEFHTAIQNDQNESIKNALQNILEFIQGTSCDIVSGSQEVKIKGKDAVKKFHEITNKRPVQLYFLTGQLPEKQDTYQKKLNAIKTLKDINSPQSKMLKEYTNLDLIMEYYLAVKIMRNRMNHASDSEISESEQEVINFLKNDSIDIGFSIEKQNEKQKPNFDFTKLKTVLSDGIHL